MALLRLLVCAVVLASAVADQEPPSNLTLPSECVHTPDKACIRKCCPHGEGIVDRDCEPSDFVLELHYFNETTTAHPESYVLVYGNPCKYGKYRLEPHNEVSDEFYIAKSGFLTVPKLMPGKFLGPNDFCMEAFAEDNGSRTLPLVCFTEPNKAASPPASLHAILYPIGLLISVPFLIFTLVMYSLISELKNLSGKALICYCSCMAIAYFSLAVVQIGKNSFSEKFCVPVAFIIQFSFIACFFWLNILCIDAFWHVMTATGVITTYPGYKEWVQLKRDGSWVRNVNKHLTEIEDQRLREEETLFARRVFVGYSVYAWCLPFMCILLTKVKNFSPIVPSSYMNHNMMDFSCLFTTEDAALPYFYGPIGCVIAVNTILFAVTIYKICTFKWNTRGLHRLPKQKARMCINLFVMMVISWVIDIVSWAVGGPPYVWTATDVINALHGIIVFIIFIMEPRVKQLVKNKLWPYIHIVKDKCCCTGQVDSIPSSPIENRTMVTHVFDDLE